VSEEEAYEIKIDYNDGVEPTQYRAKERDGVFYLYGYNSKWKGWKLVAVRFEKYRFKTVEMVEQYLNNELKNRLISQISAGVWNSRIANELLVLLSISEPKLKNASVKRWELW
jgi:hypothetical protein